VPDDPAGVTPRNRGPRRSAERCRPAAVGRGGCWRRSWWSEPLRYPCPDAHRQGTGRDFRRPRVRPRRVGGNL